MYTIVESNVLFLIYNIKSKWKRRRKRLLRIQSRNNIFGSIRLHLHKSKDLYLIH